MSGTNPATGLWRHPDTLRTMGDRSPGYRKRKLGSACGDRQVRVGTDLRQSLTRLAAAEPEYKTKGGHT